MGERIRIAISNGFRRVKTGLFVEPRFSTLYGIVAGIFLSAAMEFLLSSFTNRDETSGCLELPGALFLVASVATALVAWEMQSFGSHLARHGALDASSAVKRDELNKWGRLPRLWLYLTISVLTIGGGVVTLFMIAT